LEPAEEWKQALIMEKEPATSCPWKRLSKHCIHPKVADGLEYKALDLVAMTDLGSVPYWNMERSTYKIGSWLCLHHPLPIEPQHLWWHRLAKRMVKLPGLRMALRHRLNLQENFIIILHS
jgi:hypothetical protein